MGVGRCNGPLWVGLGAGLLFSGIGFSLLQIGLRRARRWLTALTSGTAVEGTLTNVFRDRGQSINKRNPVQLNFRFEGAAGRVDGFVTSWDRLSEERQVGERVWVVLDPRDTASCSLWPPVR